MTIVRAPFTEDQVASLNAYQRAGAFHEYTCGNDACHSAAPLVASRDGWLCTSCGYRQDWAHLWTANGAWATPVKDLAPGGDVEA